MTKPPFADHGFPVSRLQAVVGVVVFSLVSLGLKLHGAFTHPIWADELFQREFALRSTWLEFFSWTHDSPFYDWPPLSFMVMRLLVPLTGAGAEMTWRVPGLLAAVLCVPLIYRLARNFGAPRLAGLAAAGLCACDLNLNYSAQVARGYPYQLFFLLLGFTLCTDKVINHRAAWIAGSLAFVGALWSNLLSFVFLAGVWCALVVQIYFQSRKSKAPVLPAAFADRTALAVTVALAACAPHFVAQLMLRTFHGYSAPSLGDWDYQMSFVRWQLGKLTWVQLPLANPLLFLAAFIGLALAPRDAAGRTSRGILAGALSLIACQPYIIAQGTAAEPRYLLMVSASLWLGWIAALKLLPSQAGRILLFLILGVIPAQAWRAWNNEAYFGSIAGEREMGRHFAQAIRQAKSLAGKDAVHIAPCSADIPLAARHENVDVRDAAKDVALPPPLPGGSMVWLLGAQSKARATVASLSGRWWNDAAKQREFIANTRNVQWTIVVESAEGAQVIYFGRTPK